MSRLHGTSARRLCQFLALVALTLVAASGSINGGPITCCWTQP